MTTRAEAAEQLRYLTSLRAPLPNAKTRAIGRAAKAGLTQTEIADALGITRQGLDDFMRRNGVKA